MNPRYWAERSLDLPAIVLGGQTITYAELAEQSAQVARFLREGVGLTVGDRIAIWATNRLEYLVIAWAAQIAGLRWTTINTALELDEVEDIVKNCGAHVLFCSIEVKAQAEALVERTPAVRRLVIGGRLRGYEAYETAIASHSPAPIESPEGQPMLCTAGTTAKPKIVKRPIDLRSVDPEQEVLQHELGVTRGSVFLVPGPLYDSATVLLAMAAHRLGATVVLMERFDARTLLGIIARRRVTHVHLVPTMMTQLVQLPDAIRDSYDASSVRRIVHTGAPCDPDLKEAMIEWFGPIVGEALVMTEGFGWTFITSGEADEHWGSVGIPRGGEVHILDEHGRVVVPGDVGTVWWSAPGGKPLPGRIEYVHDPEATARAYNDRGWATTGDLGTLNGPYLYLAGRQSTMIVSGGMRILTFDVEEALRMHPKVADVVVVGVYDPEWEQRVHAVVELGDPGEASDALEAELIAFCRDHIDGYLCPKGLTFVDELPYDPSGKLRKRALDDLLS